MVRRSDVIKDSIWLAKELGLEARRSQLRTPMSKVTR